MSSVSYTHLDVYKRQDQECAHHLLCVHGSATQICSRGVNPSMPSLTAMFWGIWEWWFDKDTGTVAWKQLDAPLWQWSRSQSLICTSFYTPIARLPTSSLLLLAGFRPCNLFIFSKSTITLMNINVPCPIISKSWMNSWLSGSLYIMNWCV